MFKDAEVLVSFDGDGKLQSFLKGDILKWGSLT